MKIVIIGNGICGITAARWIRKMSDHEITVISDETDHFYSRTALMYIYMGQLSYKDTKGYEDWFWPKNRINLVRNYVEKVDPENKKLQLQSGTELSYDKLILATGSRSNMFGWPGQDLKGVQGLYGIPDLELMEKNTAGISHAVVVGGGLIGIEMAEMLHTRRIPVTFLIRENSYANNVLPNEESEMVNREIREHGIDLKLSTELGEISGDDDKRVKAVKTKDGAEISCQFVGLTVGVHPNVGFLKNSGIEIEKGVLIDENLQTNYPDIYAGGDCAQLRNVKPSRNPIEPVWYRGKIMGKVIAENICGKEAKYDQGVWYNSARLFTIDYQVYGHIDVNLENDETIYYEDPTGKKSIRINYDKTSKTVTGFNLMGVHYRHLVCEKWIAEKKHIEEVLEFLPEANFDPEFYKTFEQNLVDVYNQKTDSDIKIKRKKGLRKIFA